MKKKLTFLVCFLLTFFLITSNIFAFGGGSDGYDGAGGPGGNEDYYISVSKMVQSYWQDDYFAKATLSIQDSTIEIDYRTINLKDKISVEQNELMFSEELLNVLGIQVQKNDNGATISKNGKTIELIYGESAMNVNGRKKVMHNPPAFSYGITQIPESVITEEGLGFEIDRSYENIVITNDFQTMRVLTKIKPGAALPADIQTEQMIAGPDNLYILQFGSVDEAKAAYKMLNASSSVIYAEPDGIFTIAGALPVEAGSMPQASYPHLGWGPGRIDADTYMDYLIANGKQNASATVAVLDTGLDMKHSYFFGRYVKGYNFVGGNDEPTDDHWHGTHVSGTVIDVTIAMPNVKVMPVKVLDATGHGVYINLVNGMKWAVENGANVINASLIGPHNNAIDSAIIDAVNANVTVVVAAGNYAGDTKFYCPAHCEEAITVSAITRINDNKASFTNYGEAVDVAAPGEDIVSAYKGGGTMSANGTSMASPHVAGAAALLLCNNPASTPAEIKSDIHRYADKKTPGFDLYYGYGVLNIGNAARKEGPSAPLNFKATPGDRQVDLSWEAPSSDGGSPITDYQVSKDNGLTWVSASGKTAYSFTGLINGTTYTFKVRAKNTMDFGDEASTTLTLATVPGAPQNLTATPGDRQVTISWEAPSSDGGSAILYYQVSKDNGLTWVSASGANAYTFSGLINGMTYTFKVRALNAVGFSDEATTSATSATVPGAPQNLTAIPGDRQVALSWEDPLSDGGSPILDYQVSKDNGLTWVSASGATAYTFTGL
ncbi:MAG: S8 family serine peptidase, partial [Clostridiales bacterium]|nr:S8 family serine peptidase [Clostridiales bacterium]